MDNLTLQAIRQKLRWNYKGQISLEELCDLSLPTLATIVRDLNKQKQAQLQQSDELDFLGETTELSAENQDLLLRIAKQIYLIKKVEAQAAKEQTQKAVDRARILDILQRKREQNLENTSEEELLKMLNS